MNDLTPDEHAALFNQWPNARIVVFEASDTREFIPRIGQLAAGVHRRQSQRIAGVLATCYDDIIVVFTENLRQRVQHLRKPK